MIKYTCTLKGHTIIAQAFGRYATEVIMTNNNNAASYTAGFSKGMSENLSTQETVTSFLNFDLRSLSVESSKNYSFPITYTLFYLGTKRIMNLLEKKVKEGYCKFKLKCGHNYKHDMNMIKRISDTFGKSIDLALDVNHALTLPNAIRLLEFAKQHDVAMVEEPCLNQTFSDIAEIRRISGLSIMLDESVKNITDLEQAIENNAIDILNIKLGRIGGLEKLQPILSCCRKYDIPIYFGHSGELSTGIIYSILAAITAIENYGLTIKGFELVPPYEMYLFDINDIRQYINNGNIQMSLNDVEKEQHADIETLLKKEHICYSKNGMSGMKYKISNTLQSIAYKALTLLWLIEPIVVNRHNPRRGR